MSFRNVDSVAAAAEYIAGLNERWPERTAVMDLILQQVQQLEEQSPHVLELCCGAGVLGEHLLAGSPHIAYTGVDQSQPLLDAAREGLASFDQPITLIQHDLNQDAWHQELHASDRRFDAIISMQSLHDLGGEPEVSRIYQRSYDLMTSDGLFINADLIVEPGAALPNNPGRLTVARHLALLADYGFRDVTCIAQTGGFGVVAGRRGAD